MIVKSQVWSKVSSLFVKKVQSELGTNKQPSLKVHVSCVIQNRKKLCNSNSATLDAKKVKETLRRRLSENTIT